MKPLKLKPALKEIIWGGQKLKQLYHNDAMDNIAEAWVLSCHKDGQSVVDGGEFDGRPLGEALVNAGAEALGTHWEENGGFPILIKLIDAKERLSVQVHPDDDYAREHENDSGKTEAWYLLDCDAGAELIFGFRERLSKEALRKEIAAGTLLPHVNAVSVKAGDVAFIPAGTLHAIGGGILLAEVQQSSNTTYRVFDYNRKDKTGNTRELHVEKALDVLNTEPIHADFSPLGQREAHTGYAKTLLAQCDYFSMTLLEITNTYESVADETSFVSLLALSGGGALTAAGEALPLYTGDSIFIPAGTGAFSLQGALQVLETRI
ncbi:MAG: class I mannose-6-phosphate isomerase [Oscillospiraceae bacterium]|nr:class I mannose-6-phosphate isomerase [Oscillospiraceae bacterium]